ncbi:MAG: dihydroneopterin aldolase [Pseudomonadota bacterium]
MRKEPQLIRLDFESNTASPSKALSLVPQTWRIFISNLTLKGLIGIYPAEKIEPQSIKISVSATYRASVPQNEASSEHVVCYQQLVKNIEKLIYKRHILFVENLAEEIATLCLEDARVTEVTVRVEKPDAIAEAASVGVEIVRQRAHEAITLMN